SALANVAGGQAPELEGRGSARHDGVLRGEPAERLLVVGVDHGKPKRVIVGENGSEHDHVAALEVRPPVGGVLVHDRPFVVGQGLGEVRARSDEAQDEGGHAADSTRVRVWARTRDNRLLSSPGEVNVAMTTTHTLKMAD